MVTDYASMLDTVGKRACDGCGDLHKWKDLTRIYYDNKVLCSPCMDIIDPDVDFERGSKDGEPKAVTA